MDEQLQSLQHRLNDMGVAPDEVLRLMAHIQEHQGTALARGLNQRTHREFSVIRTSDGTYDVIEDRQHGEPQED